MDLSPKRNHSNQTGSSSKRLTQMLNQDRIHWLIDKCGIDPRIAAVDLESVKLKLHSPDEGEGWSKEACEQAEVEYKRFLQLYLRYGAGLYPTAIIYTVWHYHRQDPFAYRNDCMKMFEHVIPDFPLAGLSDGNASAHAGIDQTRQHYKDLFGESMMSVNE